MTIAKVTFIAKIDHHEAKEESEIYEFIELDFYRQLMTLCLPVQI